jgi:hypothetical protein
MKCRELPFHHFIVGGKVLIGSQYFVESQVYPLIPLQTHVRAQIGEASQDYKAQSQPLINRLK